MGKQYITGYKGISFADKEARQKVKAVEENQIELIEDELSMEGISDITYDTLQTTNKTLIGGVNEVNSQLKDIAYHFPYVGRMVFKSFYSIITVRG